LGELSFTPSDGCTQSSEVNVSAVIQPENYNVEYLSGNLTIENADLHIEVESTFISEGDATPTNFEVLTTGLVCGDSDSDITNFVITDQNGIVQTGNLTRGSYTINVDISALVGYDFYNISQTAGSIFVNPVVGCNDRIRASDICKSPATLADFRQITTKLQFEYTNDLDVPIFIPNGPKNILKGNAFFIGSPPELFLPGTHTFEIYTNGGRLQWEVKTPGCTSASKSANGSNADPCSNSTKSTIQIGETSSEDLNLGNQKPILYPNPVNDALNIVFTDQSGLAKIEVFDQTGRVLIKEQLLLNTTSRLQLNISSVTPGLLFVRYEREGKSHIFKVLKK
jgi:hypothetical protein